MICELTTSNTAVPFLRWAGSKKQLIPHLMPYWLEKEHCFYIEPFLGAGHLYFAVDANKSLLSDINSDLVNTYNIVKKYPVGLSTLLGLMPINEKYYYDLRRTQVVKLDDINKAARFIYLNRYCFNGLYRTNLNGEFNVPYGPDKSGKIPSIESFKTLSKKLQNTEIICSDFEKIILSNINNKSFFYLDPPYISENKIFTSYNGKRFLQSDFDGLINLLDLIDESGSFFVLSSLYDLKYTSFYKKWNLKTVSTKRNISSKTKNRNYVEELVISNF